MEYYYVFILNCFVSVSICSTHSHTDWYDIAASLSLDYYRFFTFYSLCAAIGKLNSIILCFVHVHNAQRLNTFEITVCNENEKVAT